MVTIFTALRQEAAGLIKEMSLTRENNDVYTGENIRLLLTGIGKINAAASVGYYLGKYGTSDYYVNYGSAASIGKPGETFFIGQIIDRSSGDESFPDIADTEFSHAALVTSDKPVTSYEILHDSFGRHSEVPILYDMEASSIYQVLKKVSTPDRMIFIKTATDNGNADFKKSIELIDEAAPEVARYIKSLSEKILPETSELPLFDELSADLHCSETMKNQLSQYIRYAIVSGLFPELNAYIEALKANGQLPSPDRKHGKELLQKIRTLILDQIPLALH